MKYTFSKICNVITGQVLNEADDPLVLYPGTDSRSLRHPAQTLFFAIKTSSGDGHRYIKDCYDKGVRCFIVEHSIELPGNDCNILLVPSTVDALQELAAWHRSQFNIPVIAITGSNGKTVVKEWLYQLLEADYSIIRSPKSYNSQIGVPISVLGMNETHNLAIFEAGISKPGEMERLEKVIRPTIGIFTNIGLPHQVNFTSTLQKAEEKLTLLKDAGTIIYGGIKKNNNDGFSLQSLFATFQDTKNEKQVVAWGIDSDADIFIEKIETYLSTTTLSLKIANDNKATNYELKIPFADQASLENAMHCYTLMYTLGYSHNDIQEGILHLQPVEMRLEIKAGINSSTIINDSYNSDPASLSIALDVLNQQTQHISKTLILSDILESGKNEHELYKEISDIIRQKNISRVIGIGKAISKERSNFPNARFYDTTEDFLNNLEVDTFHNEAILIKGSRAFGFERITQKLQQKAHTTVLEINLNSIIHNLNVYRSYLKPSVKVMAMVKASSYGSGAYEIASALQHHKVDYMAVAYADEGVYLRQNGITTPIMVMNSDENAFESMHTYLLEPEIYSLRLLHQFVEFIKGQNKKEHPVHIKIDTGMHRLGFEESQIPELLLILKDHPEIIVKSIFTHLASADVPLHDDFTRHQLITFENISSRIEAILSYPVLKHALNSAGAVRFRENQFDMIRLGIGLYGIDPSSEISDQLEPANSLKTHISQIKQLNAGDSVGYSRKGIIQRDSSIATIGIGYADGFLRSAGNGAIKVLVNSKEAPTIGNICMDMSMIDVTGIDVKEGDEVIIFDKDYPIELLASGTGTISYEVLTNISQRVKRIYYRE